jgi:hypothetical protein
MGRFDSVTSGRFQVSEFNVSFPVMNLRSGQSRHDPLQPVVLLQTGHSTKSRFCKLEVYKAAIGDLAQSVKLQPYRAHSTPPVDIYPAMVSFNSINQE